VRVASAGYLLLAGVVVTANFAGVELWQMPAPLVALSAVGAPALANAVIGSMIVDAAWSRLTAGG
jgi:hypothetical protein